MEPAAFGHGLLRLADDAHRDDNLWQEAARQAQLAVEELRRFYEETKYDPKELHDFLVYYDGEEEIPEIVLETISRRGVGYVSDAMYRAVMIKIAQMQSIERPPVFLGVPPLCPDVPAVTGNEEQHTITNADPLCTVMDQTGCSEAEVREALERCGGDTVKAIMFVCHV